MEKAFTSWMPMSVNYFATYVDLFAFGLIIVLTGRKILFDLTSSIALFKTNQYAAILSLGVKESSKLNSVLTSVNVAVVLFVLVAGGVNSKYDTQKIKLFNVIF